jgi:hypothetical protein
VQALRLGPTLLSVMVAAIALAPPSGRSDLIRLAGPHARATYGALAAADATAIVPQVAALVADLLDAPLPEDVMVHVYPSPLMLANGLVREVGMAPRLALELAGSAIGLAAPRAVFLLAGGDDPDRVRLVAHEVAHVVQLELAGPGARPAQWVMEGTAEWTALTLLGRLGAAGAEDRMADARAAARRYLAGDPAFTPAALRRSSEFRRWQRRVGDRLAYQVAYALADHLVARHGVPAVTGYFRAFRSDDDAGTNFAHAFGTSPEAFTGDLRAALGLRAAVPAS